jgi:hypothetical protein
MVVWVCMPLPDKTPYIFMTKLILMASCAAVFDFKKTKTKSAACSEFLKSVLERMF